jgi:hypothetical protein
MSTASLPLIQTHSRFRQPANHVHYVGLREDLFIAQRGARLKKAALALLSVGSDRSQIRHCDAGRRDDAASSTSQ